MHVLLELLTGLSIQHASELMSQVAALLVLFCQKALTRLGPSCPDSAEGTSSYQISPGGPPSCDPKEPRT